jgi:uncharacterized protein
MSPHDVQGRTGLSPLAGEAVEVVGVVTLAAPANDAPGFFLRSLAADEDASTSEGLYVAWPGAPPPRGTRVRVRGLVSENAERTELEQVERLDECGHGELEAERLDARELPRAEPWESAWVRARGEWTVLDTSEVLRTGRVTVSPTGRVFASGHPLGAAAAGPVWTIEASPGGDDANARERAERDAPTGDAPPTSAERTRAERARATPRLGAHLGELEGIVQLDGQTRRLLVPTSPAWPSGTPPAPPRVRPERLRIVALNLDNYFIDLGGLGAGSELELSRQRDKLVAALLALDADVLALTELGNRTSTAAGSSSASLADLLAGLNPQLNLERRYVFSTSEAPSGDTLRAGIAYRPARVRSRGEARFDARQGFRRPPLFQAFESDGSAFTLGVVHFKSKLCGDEPLVVPDEGCGGELRVTEAELLVASVGSLDAGPAEPVFVLGDFNADSLEPPLVALQESGFVDLLDALPAPDRYSFVFEGRASLLDHALLAPRRRAPPHEVAIWHIDADEPAFRDPSLDNPPGEYRADPRRCSDHDPIVLDLALE